MWCEGGKEMKYKKVKGGIVLVITASEILNTLISIMSHRFINKKDKFITGHFESKVIKPVKKGK